MRLHALGIKGKNSYNTLNILKNCARLDPAFQVRRAAIFEIIENWIDEQETFNFLYDCVVNDSCNDKSFWLNPRLIALRAILTHYASHPQTLPLLQNRAENEPDEQIREIVKQKL